MDRIRKNRSGIFDSKGMRRALAILLLIAASSFFTGCGARIEVIDGLGSETEETSGASTAQNVTDSSVQTTIATSAASTSSSASTTESETSTETTAAVTTQKTEEPTKTTSKQTPVSVPDVTKATGKVIAFTFDDGPNNSSADDASTKMILDKLESLGMKATFFVVGHRISYKDDNGKVRPLLTAKTNLQRMLDLGCDIGNHSYSHPNFNNMSLKEVKEELSSTNSLVEQLVGYTPYLMRPPYGNIKKDYMKELDMTVICWDVDTMDWDFYGKNSKTKSMDEIADMVYEYALTKIYSSSKIILMHDIYQSTAKAFCKLADKLVADGYTLVTISELLGSENLKDRTTRFGFDKWPS